MGPRSDFSKPCQGAAEKSANATRCCCLARGFQRVGMSTVEAVNRKISWLFCFVSHGCTHLHTFCTLYKKAMNSLHRLHSVYLEDQGSTTPIATPRTVLKEAFAAGVIQDAEEWNKIITARNITSHVYDEKTAEDVAAQICNDFFPLLKALGKFYRD